MENNATDANFYIPLGNGAWEEPKVQRREVCSWKVEFLQFSVSFKFWIENKNLIHVSICVTDGG